MAKKKTSPTRIILFLLLGIVVIIAILAGLRQTGVLGEKDTSLAVETVDIQTRDITQTVVASGKVQPEVEVVISPDVSGEIIQLPVNEGDQVNRGDLLVRIRPDFYEAQLEQAEAGVLQAKAVVAQRRADLLNAEIESKRQTDLFNKQAISESDYQRAVTQHEVAKAAYEAADYSAQSAEARLREAREQLSKTTIFSPMDGTVSILNVELGERVVGTSQMAGTDIMNIAKLDQMEIEVDVNENDVVNVALFDSAKIEIDAYPERAFKGVVTEIANSARVSNQNTQEQITNFPVKIRISDPHNLQAGVVVPGGLVASSDGGGELPELEFANFRPGMSGTVDVFTNTVSDAVVVPIQAVTVRDFNAIKMNDEANEEAEDSEGEDEDDVPANQVSETQETPDMAREDLRKVVFLFDDGVAKMVEVETGISDDTHIEIKSGLQGNEKIITGPYRAVSNQLQPDTEVRIDDGASRFRGAGGPPGRP